MRAVCLGRAMRVGALTLGAAMMAIGAWAQHGQGHPQPQAQQGHTIHIQGDSKAWSESPYMHAFYDLSKQRLAPDAPPLDFVSYRDASYAIFRDFAVSLGVGPDAMVDHLKDIPGQMVDIIKEDPKVLDSYTNFRIALAGPD